MATVYSAHAQKIGPDNWFTKDLKSDKLFGTSADKAYSLVKGKTSKTIIVAVLDSGIEVDHEDLKDVMWVNPKEIKGNGVDDDKNGYIDDIHGWNFLGNKNGKNIDKDNLELTRLYRKYSEKFGDKASADGLSGADKAQFEEWTKVKAEFDQNKGEADQNYALYQKVMEAVEGIRKGIGKDEPTVEDVKNFKTADPMANQMKGAIAGQMAEGMKFSEFVDQIKEAIDYFEAQVKYQYNLDFDPRAEFVGDNYNNPNDKNYGNNDYEGPDAHHGTHVAGIIGANRTNGKGINGIADNVRIMTVRCVPDGDERDKDVANAIRYAVDNGAKIINMSFGKSFGWDKKVVDEAVKYAESKGVLLIHAAGNDANDNDVSPRFPNEIYKDNGNRCATWIEVGASAWTNDKELTGNFSNYGKQTVDLFSPGVSINSSVPDGKYKRFNGTSMAAPAVAGVAALVGHITQIYLLLKSEKF